MLFLNILRLPLSTQCHIYNFLILTPQRGFLQLSLPFQIFLNIGEYIIQDF